MNKNLYLNNKVNNNDKECSKEKSYNENADMHRDTTVDNYGFTKIKNVTFFNKIPAGI